MMIGRRGFIRFAGAGLATLAFLPRGAGAAAAADRRFVFVIQRGAADGLATVMPVGDPGFVRLRGPAAEEGPRKLDGTFALHPSLERVGAMYGEGQVLFAHAVASRYRDRSHFDGQNLLETGGTAPYQRDDGWLNRLAATLPATRSDAVAFAPTVPAALRGPAEVQSFAPSRLPEASDDLLARVGELYAADDQLHPLWSSAVEARRIAAGAAAGQEREIARTAAAFLLAPEGPRIAMIETGGWDTHAGQAGRLANQLRALDGLLGGLRDGLGAAWADTVVLVATEFGRTAAMNGTGGTDHGTAGVAMLLGGAVKGGRVLADWPGLAPASLHEGRDLRPTASLEALIAATAGEAFGIEGARLFPDMRTRPPVGLLA